MKGLSLLALVLISCTLMSATWRTDFDKAKTEAKSDHKLILLKFSGSDWCIPCIKMEKEVFDRDTFTIYAQGHLEMVNADFPRLSKHKPSKTVIAQNDILAELYNKEGHFPYTLLLDADGRVLKAWNGYKGEKPEDLIHDIESFSQSK